MLNEQSRAADFDRRDGLAAVSRMTLRLDAHRNGSFSSDIAGAHRRRYPHGRAVRSDQLEGSQGGRTGILHGCRHELHIRNHERYRGRLHHVLHHEDLHEEGQ